MTRYDVVIPAGGTIDSAYAATLGTPFRALAPLGPNRQPVLQRIVGILRDSGCIRRVIVVAPDAVQKVVYGVDQWLPAGESGAQNILTGLAAAASDAPAIVCASDLPLVTPDSVADFLSRCRRDAQVAVGLVGADDYNQMFREAPPSEFVRLTDVGPVTLGGLFLVHPDLPARQQALFDRMFQSRKEQWRMAVLLGPRLLWGLATRKLCLSMLTERAESLLGGPVQVVPNVSPVLAYDIDTADDYTYAQFHLGKHASAPVTELPQ